MKKRLTVLVLLLSIKCFAAPKKVKISNASDTILKACVYVSTTADDLGLAAGEFKSLSIGEMFVYEYDYKNGRFIHTVVFLKNDDKIIVSSYQASSSDPKEVTINITKPNQKQVDRPEVDRMRRLIDDEIVNFSKTYVSTIRVDGDASLGLQEYLGAIAVIDTAQKDMRKAVKLLYTARQLEISETPPLSGRNFQETYKITKEFAGEAGVSVPGAFSSGINFSHGDMQEITLSCKTIGNVLLPTRPGITPIGTLLDFDEKNVENVVGTITATLDSCNTCILQQIQGLLAHSGLAVNVKRFKKSNIAFTSSASNVVTANGTYVYENGYDYFDLISARVIAIGLTGINLKTNFAQTVVEKLKVKKNELDNLVNNQQLNVDRLKAQLKEITDLISKLETYK
ncbi:hypothetical protein [Salmonirosea aquatica]|uniref:Uncharacterized protein n=1 Tax=Salmonirosea aquatica TaxID=2654236 RepID=A0A7C9BUG5_9BACT|nr:hypothetical protein [Cytophagaceae bacterium SJW1-29]